MVLESTSTLVLRSPVQGRPAIAWAAVLSQGARGLELAVTFLDSTVGGIALRLLNGTGLFDASKGGHVTGRIKDMMIVRGKNCFPDDIEKSLRRDLPILRGRRFVVFQNAEDLIYCFVEEAIEAGGSVGVPGLARDGDDEVGSI